MGTPRAVLPVPIAPGRPTDARRHLDAIFWVSTHDAPWRSLPPGFGKPDTAHRFFRRLCHAGLWERLLHALSRAPSRSPLRALEAWILRACRRAMRLLGIPLIALIRSSGLLTALPGPPWLLPDPALSEILRNIRLSWPCPARIEGYAPRTWIRILARLWKIAGGCRRIAPGIRETWDRCEGPGSRLLPNGPLARDIGSSKALWGERP